TVDTLEIGQLDLDTLHKFDVDTLQRHLVIGLDLELSLGPEPSGDRFDRTEVDVQTHGSPARPVVDNALDLRFGVGDHAERHSSRAIDILAPVGRYYRTGRGEPHGRNCRPHPTAILIRRCYFIGVPKHFIGARLR